MNKHVFIQIGIKVHFQVFVTRNEGFTSISHGLLVKNRAKYIFKTTKLKKQKQTIVYSHSSSLVLVAHWLSVSGDWGSNPCREEKNSWFVFESQSHDCPI